MRMQIPLLLVLVLACSREQPVRARITQVHGTARFESNGSPAPATIGTVLAAKDILLTEKDSHIDLTLPGGSVLRVQAETRMSLDDISKATRMRVEKGGVLLGLSKQKGDESFQIATPTAIASVRGTSFSVSTEKNSVAVLTGSVEIQKDGKSAVVESMKEVRTDRTDLKSQKLSKESARALGEILEIEGAESLDDFAEIQKNWATVAADNHMDYLPARKADLPSREAREK